MFGHMTDPIHVKVLVVLENGLKTAINRTIEWQVFVAVIIIVVRAFFLDDGITMVMSFFKDQLVSENQRLVAKSLLGVSWAVGFDFHRILSTQKLTVVCNRPRAVSYKALAICSDPNFTGFTDVCGCITDIGSFALHMT